MFKSTRLAWVLFCALLLLFITLSFLYIDRPLHLLTNAWPQSIKEIFFYLTQVGRSEVWLVPSLFLALLFWARGQSALASKALFFFSSVALAGLVNLVIKMVFGRARPILFDQHHIYGFEWFQSSSHYLSFPSGHTNTIAAVMMVLLFWFPKYRILTITMTVLVAFSRVAIGKHYLSDIVMGAFVAIIVVWSWRKYWIKRGWNC